MTATRLREFERMDLVRPAQGTGTEAAFDFRDLASLRRLVGLLRRGVSMRRIRRGIERVRAQWPDLERPVVALQLEEGEAGRLIVRHGGSRLDPDGQLLFDFSAGVAEPAPITELPLGEEGPVTALEWFERGCELDGEAAAAEEAIAAYRRAVALDPTFADAHCNLGTAYYNRGERELASAAYHAALRSDAGHREANFNLANLLEEGGRREAAVHHYKRTLAADPCFADAHLNLALLYEKLPLRRRAREHWRRYLQLAPEGGWAEVARRRLEGADEFESG